MAFLKNRTTLGIICIALSLLICFAITPLFNAGMSKKTVVVSVTADIKIGEQITKSMVQKVEVGSFNLPNSVIKNMDNVVGKYAKTEMLVGDYITSIKLSDTPAAENAYLYSLNGEKQAISVSIKQFAAGLSGKLQSGDIVSIIAPDYRKQGVTLIPAELQYVEVIAVTSNTGFDTDTGEQKTDEKELPSTVTLLVSPIQSKMLAELEADGKLHLSLVYRGVKENSDKFILTQDEVIKKLYPDKGADASD